MPRIIPLPLSPAVHATGYVRSTEPDIVRLALLADFLEIVMVPEKWDYSTVMDIGENPPLVALENRHHACGTVGCAMGWTPAVPAFRDLLTWKQMNGNIVGAVVYINQAPDIEPSGYYLTDWDVIEHFFKLSAHDAQYLFMPGGASTRYNGCRVDASHLDVAKLIRSYIAEYTVEDR